MLLEKLKIVLAAKKNIYKIKSNQKGVLPLAGVYTKIPKRVAEISDPIN